MSLTRRPSSAALAFLALVLTASGANPAVQPAAESESKAADTIRDADLPLTERADAAQRLATGTPSSARLGALTDILGRADEDPTTAVLLLRALGDRETPIAELFEPIADLTRRGPDEVRLQAIRRLGDYPTRDSIRTLIPLLQGAAESPDTPASDSAARAGDEPPLQADNGEGADAVATVAWRSLVRITGRDDLPRDHAAWREWFASVEFLREAEWHAEIAAGHGARSERLATRIPALLDELIRLHRQDYLSKPPGEPRSEKLAALILREEPALRVLGFDLATRELASGSGSLNGRVSDAAAQLLSSPSVTVRRSAADLLNRMAARDVEGLVIACLSRETDPRVAAALLDASARWPSAALRQPALAWIERGQTGGAAQRAVLALLREGLLQEPAQRQRVLQGLRTRALETLAPAGLTLLAELGEAADRDAVLALLWSPEPGVRDRAANAVIPEPWAVDTLLGAAYRAPDLLPLAADAVARHGPNSWRVLRLAKAPWPRESQRLASLKPLVDGLSEWELVLLAGQPHMPPEARVALLDPLVSANGRTPGPARQTGLVMLARAHLQLAQPASARIALNALDAQTRAIPYVVDLRATSLLATGAIDDAAALDASLEAWLLGLELSIGEPHGSDVLDAFRARFGAADLSESQASRLAELASRATTVVADDREPTEPGAEPPG